MNWLYLNPPAAQKVGPDFPPTVDHPRTHVILQRRSPHETRPGRPAPASARVLGETTCRDAADSLPARPVNPVAE